MNDAEKDWSKINEKYLEIYLDSNTKMFISMHQCANSLFFIDAFLLEGQSQEEGKLIS